MSLKRFFFIILFFFIFFYNLLYASFNYQVIENIYIKKNNSYENFYYPNLKNEYKLKIVLNKKILKEETIYLKIICDVKNIIYTNVKYIKKEPKNIIIKINQKNFNDLYFFFKYKEKKNLTFSILAFNKFEYENLYKYQQLIFGVSLGIIFCTLLYNLIIYFNIYNSAFLYYSVIQFFLLILLFYKQFYIEKIYNNSLDEIILDLSATITIIFLLLFSKEVLYLKDKHYKVNYFFNFLIIINLIDIIFIFLFNDSLLYDLINRSFIIAIILSTSIYLSLKKQKEAIFYVLGWLIIFITLILADFKLFNISENLIYTIGFPLESLSLSFALGHRLKKIIKDKESLLIQQNKLASMGEMLNNIAHQWRQPLTNLSFINMDLQLAIKKNDIKEKYLNQIVEDSNKQIDFMSKTLDNFKGFYLPNKQKKHFEIFNAVKRANSIIQPSMNSANIKIHIKFIKDSTINSYENEFIQIILNILNNAKEVLIERKIKDPYIEITIDKNQKLKTIINIQDNAGGIKKEVINKIFDPYFSTKYKNSGIGLYMVKTILDSHLKGKISVRNLKNGANFKITI